MLTNLTPVPLHPTSPGATPGCFLPHVTAGPCAARSASPNPAPCPFPTPCTLCRVRVLTLCSSAPRPQVLHQVDELVPGGGGKLPYDDLLAVALLLYFGIKTLRVGRDADTEQPEENLVVREIGGRARVQLSTLVQSLCRWWRSGWEPSEQLP